MSFLSDIAGALKSLIFPHVCTVCHQSLVDGEEFLCLHCLTDLPRTGFHLQKFSPLHQRLASNHLPIEKTAAWFHYIRQSDYRSIVIDAKYHGMPSIAEQAGEIFANEIAGSGFFDDIDIMLPVPLHPLKKMRRGYNQSEHICRGVRKVTGIAIGGNLIASHEHGSQTRRNAWERLINSRNIFDLEHPDDIDGKHVLVVDDVITTGATMIACLEAIRNAAPQTRMSVLSLGATKI